jgi:ABC-2 type transport system permease protein
MKPLFLAELNRLRSRRLTWVALAVIALVVGLVQIAVFVSVRPLTPAELAEGRAQFQAAQQDYEKNRADYQEGEKECVSQGGKPEECVFAPKPEDYASRPVVPFAQITQVAVGVVVFVSALALLFLGASLIGAEYSSGALANWLSFLPERSKVLGAKLLALVLASAVVTAAAAALTITVSAVVAHSTGATVTGVGNLVEMGARGMVIGVIGAVLGFALALLTRHTIAAAGTTLGFLLVGLVLSVLTSAIASLQGIKPWQPENNLLAFLNHGYRYQTYVNTVTDQGMQQNYVEHTISFGHSLAYWSVIMVAVVAVTFVVFRRRDVN